MPLGLGLGIGLGLGVGLGLGLGLGSSPHQARVVEVARAAREGRAVGAQVAVRLGDAEEMQGRCRGDAGEMQGRCGGDAGEMQVRSGPTESCTPWRVGRRSTPLLRAPSRGSRAPPTSHSSPGWGLGQGLGLGLGLGLLAGVGEHGGP